MKLPDLRVEFRDGGVVELTFTGETDLRHALMALETMRLELLRSTIGEPAIFRLYDKARLQERST